MYISISCSTENNLNREKGSTTEKQEIGEFTEFASNKQMCLCTFLLPCICVHKVSVLAIVFQVMIANLVPISDGLLPPACIS